MSQPAYETATLSRRTAIVRTLGYFGAFFILGAGITSLGPTIPALADHLGVDLNALKGIVSVRSLGYLSGSLLAGWLYDRYPGHRVLALAVGLIFASMLILPAAPGVFWLTIVFLGLGTAFGALDVGSNILMSRTHGPKSGQFLASMFFFAGLGSTLAPLFLAWALEIGGIPLGYQGLAWVALPVIFWIWFSGSPARPTSPTGEKPPKAPGALLALVGVLFFVFVGLEVSYGSWLYTYTINILGENASSSLAAARVTSAFWLSITVGRLAGIFLALKFSSKAIVRAEIGGAVLSLGLLLLGPAFGLPTGWVLWVGSLGLGLSLASIYPNTFALISRRLPITGSTAGRLWAAGSFGAILLPWLAGESLLRAGPGSLVGVLFAAALVSLGAFGLLVVRLEQAA